MTSTATRANPAPHRPRDPAWRKAPAVLRHTPGLLAAIVGAALLLGGAAASGPLYLASAAVATLQAEITVLDPLDAGLTVELPVVPHEDTLTEVSAALEGERARTLPELEPAIRELWSTPVTLELEGAEPLRVRLHARELRPGGDEGQRVGLTVPPGLLPVEPGDPVHLRQGTMATTATVGRVASVPTVGELPEVTGSFEEVAALAAELGATVTLTWSFPVADAAALDVESLAGRLRSTSASITDGRSELGALVADGAAYRTRIHASSQLPAAVRRATLTTGALRPPVTSLWAGALVIGLCVIGGGAALRVRRRRREHAILAARGVTPLSQATRSALECAGGIVAGTAGGVAIVALVIATVGPGGLDAAAIPRAVLVAAAAAAAALLVVGAVTGATLRGTHVTAARLQRSVARVPFELIPLGLAALIHQRMQIGATAANRVGIDPLVLAFPALAIVGSVVLAARLLGTGMPALRRRGHRARPATFLALRRLAVSPAATMTLVGLTAAAVGLAAAAGTLAASAQVTARSKAEVAVGAAAAGPLGHAEPGPLADGVTLLGRTQADARPAGTRVDVLAVDPASFADVAAWSASFAQAPLSELLAALGADTAALPIVLVGHTDPAESDAAFSVLSGRGFSLPVTVVERARTFPGSSGRPMVVVSLDRLHAELVADGRRPWQVLDMQVWADGEPDEAADRVVRSGAVPTEVRTVQAEADIAPLRAARWVLAYLQAVAAVAGLLAGVTLTLAIAERQRTTEVSYALASRMGLGRAAHRRAVALELGGLLGTALVLGIGLGIAAARLAAPWMDPFPGQPPGPAFAIPWSALGVTVLLAVVLVVAGAGLIQRHVDRVRMGQVLRAAD